MLKRIHFASPMVKSEEENLILVWQKLLVACAFLCPSPLLTYPPAQDANNKIYSYISCPTLINLKHIFFQSITFKLKAPFVLLLLLYPVHTYVLSQT
jgi:hypothetical protein